MIRGLIGSVMLAAVAVGGAGAQFQPPEVDFRRMPRVGLRTEVSIVRNGTLGGVARTADGREQRLSQSSRFVLEYDDEVLPVREGRRPEYVREFARADVLTTLRYPGDRPPELEQRTLPFDGERLRFRLRADGRYDVTRGGEPAEREPVPASLKALGRQTAFRDPHLPARTVRLGERWTVPAARVAASLAYGPVDADQTVDGVLTVRFVRVDPAFSVTHIIEAEEFGEPPQREKHPTPCAVLTVHGTWKTHSRAGTTLVATVERTLYYSLDAGILVHATGEGTWTLTGRKFDAYALDYSGTFDERSTVEFVGR